MSLIIETPFVVLSPFRFFLELLMPFHNEPFLDFPENTNHLLINKNEFIDYCIINFINCKHN